MARRKVEATITEVAPEVGTITEDQVAGTMREQAKLAHVAVDQNYLLLAEALFEIKHKEYYRKWGMDTFATYCEVELEIRAQKANNLTQIWDAVKSLSLPKEELLKIGYAKACMMCKNIEKGLNVKELLDVAKTKNARELESYIQEHKYANRVSAVASGKHDLIIKIEADSEWNPVLENGLARAKKHYETENGGEALALLVNDWMLTHEFTDVTVPLETRVNALRREYNMDIRIMGSLNEDVSSFLADDVDAWIDDTPEELAAGVI